MSRHGNGHDQLLTPAAIDALSERPTLIAALKRQQVKMSVLQDKIRVLTELLRIAQEEKKP